MAFETLRRFEREVAARKATEAEAEKRKELRKAVKEVIPKSVLVPTRPKGRTPMGGLTRREVKALREKAARYLDGEGGLRALEATVQHTALVILLIDGVLGTEPWRAVGRAHGGLIAANARMRYLENAARLLADLRQSRGADAPKLMEGVIDAEPVT